MEIHTISLEGVNSYLLKNEKGYFLIDTGYSTSREALFQRLVEAGVEPGNLKLILQTHGDIDHVGSSAYLREKYGAPIAMHPADRELVEKGILGEKKFGSWFVKFAFRLIAGRNEEEWLNRFQAFTPDIWMEDGMDFSEYGLDAKVIHIPGHSAGSVAFLTSDGDFFVGDTLMNAGRKLLLSGWAEDFGALAHSLDRLLQEKAVMVYPGHVKPFSWESFVRKQK